MEFFTVFKDDQPEVSVNLQDIDSAKRVKEFSYALSQLKYAFKTISKPKLVFLFSEGVMKWAYTEGVQMAIPELTLAMLVDYMKRIAVAANEGGAVIFTINPGKMKSLNEPESGEFSLRLLASASGGKYFEGNKVEKIITRIKTITSAYYEIAFYPSSLQEKPLPVKIKCKRKDVKIISLKYVSREKPFPKMNTFERKLYVLNIVNGGSWSRMVAKISSIKPNAKFKKDSHLHLKISLPSHFHARYGYIYVVRLKPERQQVKIRQWRKKLEAIEQIKLRPPANKEKLFFVIVDEDTGAALYGRV